MKRKRKEQLKKKRNKNPGSIVLFLPWLFLAALLFTPQPIRDQYMGPICAGGLVLLGILIAMGTLTDWFREVENDELKAVDLQILAAENKVSYLEQNLPLSELLLQNGAGLKTDDWHPHYVVHSEHAKGESWVFDTQKRFGVTVALVKYTEQEMLPMLIGVGPKPFKPGQKPKAKDMPRRQQDGRLKAQLNHLGFKSIKDFDQGNLRGKALYSIESLADEAESFIENNPEIHQIFNLKEIHFLALYERYAILFFKHELDFDWETFSGVNTRIRRILRLKGVPVKAEDEPLDEIKKLKGKL